MDKLLAAEFYGWGRIMATALTAAAGLYAEYKDQKVIGIGSTVWMLLSILYCISVVLHYQAKQLVKAKSE